MGCWRYKTLVVARSTGIGYWPPGIVREETIQAFILAYGTLGFDLCFDGSIEPGFEKVALFGKQQGNAIVPTQAALQLTSGGWASKLGEFEDVVHISADAVSGPAYGTTVCFLRRRRIPPSPR